jgi:hypothetical protein
LAECQRPSQATHISQGIEVGFELSHIVVNGNGPAGQQMLKPQTIQSGEPRGLRERQAFAFEEHNSQLLPQFVLREASAVQDFIRDCDAHSTTSDYLGQSDTKFMLARRPRPAALKGERLEFSGDPSKLLRGDWRGLYIGWLAAATASGYDEARRSLVDLADAYELCATRAQFEAALQRFMAPHTRRTALVRRLVEAGLWRKS